MAVPNPSYGTFASFTIEGNQLKLNAPADYETKNGEGTAPDGHNPLAVNDHRLYLCS